MFGKKKEKAESFLFNYVCREEEKCVSFSISDGAVSARWCDAEGKRRGYEGISATSLFWDELEALTEKHGVFGWKAHKIYSNFAFSLDSSVFNAEGVFPSGKHFAANNLHGLPSGFEEALAAYKELFASLKN